MRFVFVVGDEVTTESRVTAGGGGYDAGTERKGSRGASRTTEKVARSDLTGAGGETGQPAVLFTRSDRVEKDAPLFWRKSRIVWAFSLRHCQKRNILQSKKLKRGDEEIASRFFACAAARPAPGKALPMDVSLTYATQLKGMLDKSDGKDKFVALLQYAAMFVGAGEPGVALSAQKSLSVARKPFRVFKPIEFLMPLVEKPPKGKGVGACLAYVSSRFVCACPTKHEETLSEGTPSEVVVAICKFAKATTVYFFFYWRRIFFRMMTSIKTPSQANHLFLSKTLTPKP